MFDFIESGIKGCYEIYPSIFADSRGRFVKIFEKNIYQKYGLEINFSEEYYSSSNKGVIRGMHFQTPPEDHVKLVYCVEGEVTDVVLDLRQGSPTYGFAKSFTLSRERGNCIYLPKGMAHGFLAISKTATLVYKVSTSHSPENDSGILWSSFGFDWKVESPILSPRDRSLVSMTEFVSPFSYVE